ncbi:MAG: alpha/beta hydrolase family protein [Gemmatimonadaceae bacterium]
MTSEIGRRDFLIRSSIAGALLATGSTPVGASEATAVGTTPVPSDTMLDLADRQLDSRDFCRAVYDQLVPAMSFNATDPAAAGRWQSAARRRLTALLGGFPATRVSLRPEVLEVRDLGPYTRERVVFQTRDHLSAIGYLLLPKARPGPLPAVVCLPGHGRGADDIVGIAPDGSQRPARDTGYAKDYALQCVEQGYAAFALEQLGFGARRDPAARRSGLTADSCRPAAGAALLVGQTMVGWRAWDAMRTIDYLATRSEVDTSRIATLGASGGGTTSLFTAALDDRVRVAVVSAYFNTFRDSIVSISHCPDNYVPGLLHSMEMSDIGGLVAPRGLFVESGVRDPIFPIEGSREAAAKAQQIYRVLGVPERMGYDPHEGAHEFNGVRAFEFLERWL